MTPTPSTKLKVDHSRKIRTAKFRQVSDAAAMRPASAEIKIKEPLERRSSRERREKITDDRASAFVTRGSCCATACLHLAAEEMESFLSILLKKNI